MTEILGVEHHDAAPGAGQLERGVEAGEGQEATVDRAPERAVAQRVADGQHGEFFGDGRRA